MGKFVFSLQPLLELQTQLERQQKTKLAQSRQQLDALAEQGRALDLEADRQRRRFLDQSPEGFEPAQAARISAFLWDLGRLRQLNREQARRQAELVERDRQALEQAMRQRKLLEKLRQRRLEQFRLEETRRQEKLREDALAARLTQKRGQHGPDA